MVRIEAPPSKSETIRALFAALLSDGISELNNPSDSEDAESAIRIIEQLGSDVAYLKNKLLIRGISPKGTGMYGAIDINCGESAACLRMMLPVSMLYSSHANLYFSNGAARPLPGIKSDLKLFGIKLLSAKDYPPYLIEGDLKGSSAKLNCNYSSQFLSGLFFALPILDTSSELIIENLVSRPYIDLTIEILKYSGIEILEKEPNYFIIPGKQVYNPINLTIRGDWSSAAYFVVAGAVKGGIELSNLDFLSLQADKVVLDALELAGGNYRTDDGSVKVFENPLNGFNFDVTGCPDLLPALVLLALFSNGISRFSGIGRLKYKESSRAETLCTELSKSGVEISMTDDCLTVCSGMKKQVKFNVNNDHRIAMTLILASYLSGFNAEIDNYDCIAKSYPGFMKSFEQFQKSIV